MNNFAENTHIKKVYREMSKIVLEVTQTRENGTFTFEILCLMQIRKKCFMNIPIFYGFGVLFFVNDE